MGPHSFCGLKEHLETLSLHAARRPKSGCGLRLTARSRLANPAA